MNKDYFPLTPCTQPWMHRLIDVPKVINELLRKYGSPINIHHLPTFYNNVRAYNQVFGQLQLQHQVFFARKANKCKTFAQAAQQPRFGVDTASFNELQQCLDLGCPTDQLVFTAAVKTQEAVRLAISRGVLIILDNAEECRQVADMAAELQSKAVVGIRLSGFMMDNEKLYSRFGVDIEQLETFILDTFQKHTSLLSYQGLHFHLDGYSTKQRSAALAQCLEAADRLERHGLSTHFIDIGGGFLVNYLEYEPEWEEFWEAMREAQLQKRPPLTFRNKGLGLFVMDGVVRGASKVYPYYNKMPKTKFLEHILSHELPDKRTLTEALRERRIEIRIEPGRSLLDGAGVTVGRVAFTKQDAAGQYLVGLEMNMTQLYSSSADFLLDPYVIFQEEKTSTRNVDVVFTGAYCLERDVILKRKIRLEQLPAPGDLVIFMNTAGYMMHFFESEAHLFKLAKNLFFEPGEGAVAVDDFKEDK